MAELKKDLTLFDMTMIAIGATIGSGIFLTPSLIAQSLPAPLWIGGIWILGGMMALSGALTFAELGAMMPRAGGVYVFLTEAYGGLIGFLYGWTVFLVTNTGAIAALAIAFATYFSYFLPLSPVGIKLFGIGGIVLVTVINVVGVKAGGVFSDIFTLLKLAGIAVLIIVGLGWGSTAVTNFMAPMPTPPNGMTSALTLAFISVLWSFGGWQHASFTAAEAKDPKRSVPLSLIFGALIVTVVYLAVNVAYMLLLSPAQIAASPRIAADAISVVLGPLGGSLIAITIFISTFGTTGIYTLTAPRIYYAMANDGVFFKRVAEVHPRFRTPMFAIIFQSTWAIVLILFWGTFESLISYVVFTDWIFFALTGASIFIFRKRIPDASRPYRTLGYPVTSMFFVAVAAWFVVNTLFEKPLEAGAGIMFLALGVPVYYFWRRKNEARPAEEERIPG
jgi:APA family basic amino acid/polyamine antiporter